MECYGRAKREIELICKSELKELTKEKREELLLGWWGIDQDDAEFALLPESLRKEMIESDEPITDAMGKKYDPLIMEALKHKFIGVKNAYISKKMLSIFGMNVEICGEEMMLPCLCCGYK